MKNTNNGEKPLLGFVTFHLHNTFRNQNPIVAVKNGVAELMLNWVYGAFTIGPEADDGKTKLELDLAELPEEQRSLRTVNRYRY